MKFFYALLFAALIAIPTVASAAIAIDGVADTDYGSAISTQALGTTAFDSTSIDGVANGSELDAAYGFVSNGVLFLTIGGNFNATGNSVPYDTLHVFFRSDDGGDGNILPTFDNGGFGNRRNNMTGMTFDTGFNPNYWIYINTGSDGVGSNVTMYVDYVVVCSNCPDAFLGSVMPTNSPPNVLTNIYFGNVMQFAMDNSNTGGVTSTACTTNLQGAAQSVAASAVRSGIEMAIPLATIGSPTGSVRVCAFLTEQTMASIYNQALGPFDGGAGYCQDYGGNNLTATSGFDFNAYPGLHSFQFTVPPCEVFKVNPTSDSFAVTGGVGSVSVVMNGSCAWSVTSDVSWVTITSGGGPGSGNFTYSVSTNATIFPRIATLTIGGLIATQNVSIAQDGAASPPLASFIVDGVAEAAYGCPVAVQIIGTGFGNNARTNIVPTTSPGNAGSELDAAYAMVQNDVLFLTLAGNLEFNGNEIMLFLMTGPGGQNTLTNVNPNIGGLNSSGTTTNGRGPGLTFGAGFAPNYWIGLNGTGSGSGYRLFVDYAQLWPLSTNVVGVATNGYFVGSSVPTNGTLTGIGFFNPYFIQATINNSNTNGVSGDPGGGVGCPTNTIGEIESDAAALVRTGVELAIPLSALGSPTGAIAVCAYITGGGDHTYLSNQILPPFDACQANLGSITNASAINFGTLPGSPTYFLVGPEMRVTRIQTVATNAVVSFQTAANSNLLYQVQRTSAITNTAWTAVTAFTNGTGGITTLTILNGATNKPAQFYRVRQATLCP